MNPSKEKKPVEPVTLAAFAQAKKPVLARLAEHIQQTPETTWTQEIEQWCNELEAFDPHLVRTQQGIFGLYRQGPRQVAFAKVWLREVLATVFQPPLPANAPDRAGRLWHLLDRMKVRTGAEDNHLAPTTQKGRNALALALLLEAGTTEPTPLTLREVLNAWVIAGFPGRNRVVSPEEMIRAQFADGAPDFAQLWALVAPWERELEDVKTALHQAEGTARAAGDRAEGLEERLREARAEIREEQDRLQKAEDRCAAKDAEVAQLLGRMTVLMRDRDQATGEQTEFHQRNLTNPLTTVLAALTAEEPSLGTAVTLIQHVLADIEAFRH